MVQGSGACSQTQSRLSMCLVLHLVLRPNGATTRRAPCARVLAAACVAAAAGGVQEGCDITRWEDAGAAPPAAPRQPASTECAEPGNQSWTKQMHQAKKGLDAAHAVCWIFGG